MEQPLIFPKIELTRERGRAAVSCNLVMLELLRGGEETRVAKIVAFQHTDHLVGFLDQRLQSLVGVRGRGRTMLFQNGVKPLLLA